MALKEKSQKELIKEIEALYNVKPEKPKDMEYTSNISEVAHKTPVVLFQSHDKINSLVENINERQNIMVNILRKVPNGHLTNKRYAQDLGMSLIRIANDMDNQNKEELRVLADVCANQLHKTAFGLDDVKKFFSEKGSDTVDVGTGAATGAAIGSVVGGLLGVLGGPLAPATVTAGISGGAITGAALGGVISSILKTSPQAKNVTINAEIARNELADLIKKFPSDASLQELDTALLHITDTAAKYAQLVDKMHSASATSGDKEEVQKIASEYLKEIAKLNVLTAKFVQSAKQGRFEEKESDWLSKLKTPLNLLIGDDVDDEVKAIEALGRTLSEAEKGINDAKREAMSLVSHVESVKSENTSQKSEHEENIESLRELARKSGLDLDF